ncbi:SRPBCC family protein [Flavobacterium cellulosilyticum]|uniref:Transcriptional regulator n=1 Tax=Flavobacterium cellulosilyticum TaxID=2541731 RepID=A0A4R5CAV7_9FLAO|nr:transcriptional regulator [Flavobacterium cellulosilyticum]TDD94192.1 transcriptional regulator [Flavobacterium cellulosilyticum]
MRILKYLFLLLLLSIVALSIFVATQKGNFTVERSKVINSPRHSVFNYVNDLKNWGEWNSIAVEDSLINLTYSKNTIGKGSSCTWNGNQDDGDLLTINTKEDTNIVQKINFNGNSADIIMNFKDTIGGTKITWKAIGKMNFIYKVKNVLSGGAEKILGILFEKSLVNLDNKLDYEINTFSIKEVVLTNRPETLYLAQTFTSEFSKVIKNSGIVISKITNFCNKNNITISGKPFIIYHTYDEINKLTKISVCIPIKDPIFIIEGSDISSKKLKAFQAVKTTLTGDYFHTSKALDKTKEYIRTNHLISDPDFSHIEVLTIGINEIKNPSKWMTEIYYPIATNIVVKPTIQPLDTVKKTPIIKKIPLVKTEPTIKIKRSVKTVPSVKSDLPVKSTPTLKTEPAVKNKKETSSEF